MTTTAGFCATTSDRSWLTSGATAAARMASRVFAIPQRGLAQLVRANTSQARMDILDQNVAVKRVYANRPAWQVVSQSSLGCAAALAWALLTDRPLLGSRSANIG